MMISIIVLSLLAAWIIYSVIKYQNKQRARDLHFKRLREECRAAGWDFDKFDPSWSNYDNSVIKRLMIMVEDSAREGYTSLTTDDRIDASIRVENAMRSLGYEFSSFLLTEIRWDFEKESEYPDHPMSVNNVRRRNGLTFIKKVDMDVVESMVREIKDNPDAVEVKRGFGKDKKASRLVEDEMRSRGYNAISGYEVDDHTLGTTGRYFVRVRL